MRAAKDKAGAYSHSAAKGFCGGGRVHRATGGRISAPDELSPEGGASKPRLDRAPRGGKPKDKGGKGHGGTNVNVIIAGKDHGAGAPPAGPGPLAGPPPAMPPMPPKPPMLPPGAGAGGPPPGMLPRARGGRVCKAEGGSVEPVTRSPSVNFTAKGDKLTQSKDQSRLDDGDLREGGSPIRKSDDVFGSVGRAAGGRVKHSDEAADKALFNKMFAEKEGKPHREGRAFGGRLKAGAESGVGRLEKIGKKP